MDASVAGSTCGYNETDRLIHECKNRSGVFQREKTMIALLKLLLVVLILIGMVMVLLGINHLSSGNLGSNEDDTAEFRKEVKEDEEVMGRHSAFRQFLGQGEKKQ